MADHAIDIDAIIIASPNNPTGSMYDPKELEKLAIYCRNNNIQIISDEIYHGITYEQKAATILQYDSNAIVINGFSKYFAMTGWRVGWMIVDANDIPRYESMLQNLIICGSPLNQIAAIKAFSAYDELDAHVLLYKKNRDILYSYLTNIGVSNIYKPPGGFYIYVELEGVKLKAMDLCKKLLHEEGVAEAPGLDFIENPSICSIRLSFCQPQAVIELGAQKINNFLSKL